MKRRTLNNNRKSVFFQISSITMHVRYAIPILVYSMCVDVECEGLLNSTTESQRSIRVGTVRTVNGMEITLGKFITEG